MLKKYVAWLCVVVMIIGCFSLTGCGSSGDKESWDGVYYGLDQDKDNPKDYAEVEVTVDDGFMMINIKKDYDDYNGEGNFENSDDGNAISIPIKYQLYDDCKAELRKLASKYYLTIESDEYGVQFKCELAKNAKKEQFTHAPIPTTQEEKVVETTAKKEVKKKVEKKVKKKAKKKKASSVKSDFKKTMDDYEDFIDDYVAFMKKYKKASASDQAGMLSDYSDMASKYSKLSSEITNLEADLSGNDLKYYTKVMARVAKKLAKVS